MAEFAATEDTLRDTMEAAREKVLAMAAADVKQEAAETMDTDGPSAPSMPANATAPVVAAAAGPPAPPTAMISETEKSLTAALRKAKDGIDLELANTKRERTPRRGKGQDPAAVVPISDEEPGL